MRLPLRGIVPPMVTPMSSPRALNLEGIDRLLEHLIAGGASGVFALGTTGEAAALGLSLRRTALKRICETVDGRIHVLAAISDPSLAETIALARHAADSGADAVAVSAPYYVPPDQAELYDFFAAIAEESPLPVFLYNIPQLTHMFIEPDTVGRLSQLENIVGIKDSSGDLEYFSKVVAAAGSRENWTLLVGMEEKLAQAMQHGAHGCVGGGANVWPRNLVGVYEAAAAGDHERAAQLGAGQAKLLEICRFGTLFPGIIRGLKCGLDLLGICRDVPAAPLHPCNAEQRAFIQKRLIELGVLAK